MAPAFEKTEYGGWPNCFRLSNGTVDLVLTSDVGPRIIRFGFVGKRDEFKEYAEQLGMTSGDEWRVYGGHRLWRAPEHRESTYVPDNSPIQIEQQGDSVRAIQVEPSTGLRKEIEMRLGDGAAVEVVHRLQNDGATPIEAAPWAVSVMAPGGSGVAPLPPHASHEESLLPAGRVVLWPYTDMTDARWTWGGNTVLLRQDATAALPQKAGFSIPDGWAGYWRDGTLFVKAFDVIADAVYPDLGCQAELFTNSEMLELETLGPLGRIDPGSGVEHRERWLLLRDVPLDAVRDAARDALRGAKA